MKICIRNNYIVKDRTTWFDHLNMLYNIGMDIRNPKFICPANMHGEHQKLIRKVARINKEKRIAEQKALIAKENPIYQKAKKPFLGMVLSDGMIDLAVLNSLEEFIEEGEAHHHCIYSSGYYKKENSLIFSARKGDARLCTVQVKLDTLEVAQARGLQNKKSEYQDEIIQLIEQNKKKIRKLPGS